MHIVVLDAVTTEQGSDCWAPLRALGDVEIYGRSTPSEVLARVARADVVITNKVVIGASEIAAAPSLRYVGLLSTGYNVVDVVACRARGVAVANVPGYSTASVAQLVFAFLLHHAQDVAGHADAVRAGKWATAPDFCFTLRPMRELAGQTLAIVGSGAIGSAVARIADGFAMRVLRCAVPGSSTPGRVPLAEALPVADAVTLHCPLTPSTTRLVDARFLTAMKSGAVLINTGRGGLIDEAALLTALRDGHLGAACLDVLSAEPPAADHPLLKPGAPWAARLSVTPHIGWATVEARTRLVAEVADNVRAFQTGNRRNRVD
ncbi:MAG: D-2-hydroxyacid dehydrogenase [Planctomycetota bacterium]